MTLGKPATIPEAIGALRRLLPAEQLEVIRRSSGEDLIRFHFNLGSYIRNLWVHRDGSPLAARIRATGGQVGDGDELSRLIIEALWHDLNGRDFDLRGSSHFQHILQDNDAAPQLVAVLLQST
jgi:hypothetical protein